MRFRIRRDVLRYLIGAFLIAPAFSAILVFLNYFIPIALWQAPDLTLDAEFYNAVFVALYFGVPLGILYGLIVAWPLRCLHMLQVLPTLALCYLPFALLGILFGTTYFFGFVGFWVGYVLLLEKHRKRLSPA